MIDSHETVLQNETGIIKKYQLGLQKMNKRAEKRDYQLSGHAPDEAGVNLEFSIVSCPSVFFFFSFGHVYIVHK